MRSSRLTLLSVPLVAIAIAGCGGGDDEPESTTPAAAAAPTTTALTKDELILQGNAICAEVNAAIGGIEAAPESEGRAGQVADLYVGMVESLKRLGTPDEAAGYAEFSAAADELSQAEGEVKLASERGDSAALATAEATAASALESFRSAADSYGFEDCGEGPSAAPGGVGTEPPVGEAEIGEEALEEEVTPEEEVAPEEAPETGGAGSTEEGGGTGGGATGGGGETGGSSGGIGPG